MPLVLLLSVLALPIVLAAVFGFGLALYGLLCLVTGRWSGKLLRLGNSSHGPDEGRKHLVAGVLKCPATDGGLLIGQS
jgi:hypothetical protein